MLKLKAWLVDSSSRVNGHLLQENSKVREWDRPGLNHDLHSSLIDKTYLTSVNVSTHNRQLEERKYFLKNNPGRFIMIKSTKKMIEALLSEVIWKSKIVR